MPKSIFVFLTTFYFDGSKIIFKSFISTAIYKYFYVWRSTKFDERSLRDSKREENFLADVATSVDICTPCNECVGVDCNVALRKELSRNANDTTNDVVKLSEINGVLIMK